MQNNANDNKSCYWKIAVNEFHEINLNAKRVVLLHDVP